MRVIQISGSMAGDIAGMVLADNGAEVIKVESPDEDPSRAFPGRLVWGRGKKSVVLDLDSPEGRESLVRIARDADGLIEEFGPGRAEQLGIGYQALSSANPGLVYVAISGYGEKGPLRDYPAHEDIVSAKTGRMSSQVGFREGPIFTPAPIASYGAGMLAIQGMLAAIYARKTTGRGQRVSTSLLHALVAYDMSGHNQKMRVADPGTVKGVMVLAFMTPQCKDGRYLQMCSRQPHLFRNWMRTMELERLYDDPVFAKMPDVFLPKEEMDKYADVIQEAMLKKTSDEWLEIHSREDVGSDPFLTPAEFMALPQMIENGRVATVVDPTVGPTTQIGPLVNMSETPSVIGAPAPALGQDTEAVLAGLTAKNGSKKAPSTNGRASLRYPLEGVTIIDNAFFYAAPFAATLLSEMGARVIKIEPPVGDPTRRNWIGPYTKSMQGKESIILDLKKPEALEVLYKLVAKADIFLHNFRPGVTHKLKTDFDTLIAINPRLIYLYGSCYGSNGPWSHRPGFHSTPSAVAGSGIYESGRGNPPRDRVYPDPAGALGVATAAMLGLTARDRTGKGQYLETTMINSAGYALSHWGLQYEGKPEDPMPDQGQHGYHALHRLYKTEDGWIFLMCPDPGNWETLAKTLGLSGLTADAHFASPEARRVNDGELARLIGEAMTRRSADEIEAALLADGVPAARADGIDHHTFMVDDPQPRENAMSIEDEQPNGERFWRAANCTQFSEMTTKVMSPKNIGWATESVLRELGYDDRAIEELDRNGVTKLAIEGTVV
jgi:crotonobetainyl-CoA:carnitine CoA-transferase CaiB-like acyl-CoA transferase